MWHLFLLFLSCSSLLNAAVQPVNENLQEPSLRDNKRSLTFSVTMGFLTGMYTSALQDEQHHHHSSDVIRPMAITVLLTSLCMKDPQRPGYRKLSWRESWARALGMHTMSYGVGFFSGQLLRVVVKTDIWNRAWNFVDEQLAPESAMAGLTVLGALIYAGYRFTRPQVPAPALALLR